MIGLIETLLTNLLGQPKLVASATQPELIWKHGPRNANSTLYKGMQWNRPLLERLGDLKSLYGDARGASMFDGNLKLAIINGPAVWGLYELELLQAQPEVLEANRRDPDICFFMDSANVWFYGIKNSNLFVFDTATDELDCLGPVAEQLEELFVQWADTTAS